jgi:hypothetical protein
MLSIAGGLLVILGGRERDRQQQQQQQQQQEGGREGVALVSLQGEGTHVRGRSQNRAAGGGFMLLPTRERVAAAADEVDPSDSSQSS